MGVHLLTGTQRRIYSMMSIGYILLSLCCGTLGCQKKQIILERYRLEAPQGAWRAVESGSADYAWYNAEIGATIYVDSNCGQRFEDRPLRDSLNSLTAGIRTETEPVERALFLDGREARMLQSKGRLDGVEIQMAAVALAKDRCLYDFVYVTRPESFHKGFGDFHQLLHSFETRASWNDVMVAPKRTEQRQIEPHPNEKVQDAQGL